MLSLISAHGTLRVMDEDELRYLEEFARRRDTVLSVPHFPAPRIRRGILDVLESLEQKGFVSKAPKAPLPHSYKLTEAGIEHCGGLSVFAR